MQAINEGGWQIPRCIVNRPLDIPRLVLLGAHQHLNELAEGLARQRLSEDVGNHVLGLDVADGDALAFDLLADVVVRDVDVLCGCAIARIVALGDAALAVAPERDGWPWQAQFYRQVPVEGALASACGPGDVLAVVGTGGNVGV